MSISAYSHLLTFISSWSHSYIGGLSVNRHLTLELYLIQCILIVFACISELQFLTGKIKLMPLKKWIGVVWGQE